MSPWLFNVYMDGVVREVNARVLGRVMELMVENENVEIESVAVCG